MTNTTTLAGLQEILNSDSVAMFKMQSTLFGAVYAEDAGQNQTVRFMAQDVPSAVSSTAQGASIVQSDISISAVDKSLAQYPFYTIVSKQAWDSKNAPTKVANTVAGSLARSIDTVIGGKFSGFDTSYTINSFALSSVFYYGALLQKTGFQGEVNLVINPIMFANIATDLSKVPSTKQEDILGRGYISTVAGVNIFVSPWLTEYSTTAGLAGIYVKEAVGLGHQSPLVEVSSMPLLSQNGIEVLGVSNFVADVLTPKAGFGLKIVY